MTHPPPRDQLEEKLRDAQRRERAAAVSTQKAATEALPRGVERIARNEARKTARRWGIAGIIFTILLSLGVSVAAYSTASSAAVLAASTRETVDAALDRLGEANRSLEARGQEPVQTPPEATPAEAIQAAVLAQVLAALPPSPTAEDVASRIQGAVVAQILGPTQSQLAGLVADYFSTNPPQPGPAPTDAQIQAAVDRAYAANPPPAGRDGAACTPDIPSCRGDKGDDGDTGQAGISVIDQQFVRLPDLTCVSRVTFSDGTTRDSPAGDAACPLLPAAMAPASFNTHWRR